MASRLAFVFALLVALPACFAVKCRINGCTRADAAPTNLILFPTDDGNRLVPAYFPPCIFVSPNQAVRFQSLAVATFQNHPLRGAVFDPETGNLTLDNDPDSPLSTVFDAPVARRDISFSKPVRKSKSVISSPSFLQISLIFRAFTDMLPWMLSSLA